MALPKIWVVKPKPGDVLVGCIHAGSPMVTEESLKRYVGVPTISIPALHALRDRDGHYGGSKLGFNLLRVANFHENGGVVEFAGDFVQGPPPDPAVEFVLNRFLKTE